jgi:hypothetical protein
MGDVGVDDRRAVVVVDVDRVGFAGGGTRQRVAPSVNPAHIGPGGFADPWDRPLRQNGPH